MRPPTSNWRQRRNEHHFYEEILTDITTRDSERNGTIIGQHKKKTKKINNTDPNQKNGLPSYRAIVRLILIKL